MMRTTSSPKTAALRLAEATGFTMQSSGNRWCLSLPMDAPEAAGGVLSWPSPMTAEQCLGVMVDIATQRTGFGASHADVWDLCQYVPRRDPKDGLWDVEDTWQGTHVARMLTQAREAGREALADL